MDGGSLCYPGFLRQGIAEWGYQAETAVPVPVRDYSAQVSPPPPPFPSCRGLSGRSLWASRASVRRLKGELVAHVTPPLFPPLFDGPVRPAGPLTD